MRRLAILAPLLTLSLLAIPTAVGAAPSSAPPGTILKGGQSLKVGTDTLAMLKSGDLLQYDPAGTVRWDSGTGGNPGAWAVMQTDGNFVVYSASGSPLWASGTNGNPGDCLVGRATTGVYSWVIDFYGLVWPQFSITPCYIGSGSQTVSVVGDSITWLSQNALIWIGYSSLAMQVSGESGFTLEQQVPSTKSLVANPDGSPSAVVMELGSNDALTNNASWQTGFNDEVSAIGNRCTVFVSVNQNLPGANNTISQDIDNDEAFDAYVDSAQYHYLDPGWGTTVTLQSDGIHPDSNGQTALAQEEIQSVQQDC